MFGEAWNAAVEATADVLDKPERARAVLLS
jgi:hypothetical protein